MQAAKACIREVASSLVMSGCIRHGWAMLASTAGWPCLLAARPSAFRCCVQVLATRHACMVYQCIMRDMHAACIMQDMHAWCIMELQHQDTYWAICVALLLPPAPSWPALC
jgi:hypothetical protein